jgi:DNA topoisomerase-3
MMNLYVCEKKTVAKALSDVLPGEKKREGNFIRCGSDIVAWASGHLLELCEPEDYDPTYKQWSRGTLLYVPDRWKLKPKERTKALLSGLRKLIQGLQNSDVVVNVGDGDREGQTLIDEILEYCGWHGQTKRLRLNDVNPDAVRSALDNVKDNSLYRGEYMAGQARMRADWTVGLVLTRFVTVSLRDAGYDAGVISVGRVQTPTLGLVVERDREIREFVPSVYFDLRAALTLEGGRTVTGRWMPNDSCTGYLDAEGRLVSREMAADLEEKLRGANGAVTKVEKRTRETAPPLPFSLPRLQMAASKNTTLPIRWLMPSISMNPPTSRTRARDANIYRRDISPGPRKYWTRFASPVHHSPICWVAPIRRGRVGRGIRQRFPSVTR